MSWHTAPGGRTTARSSRRWRHPAMLRLVVVAVDHGAGSIEVGMRVREHRRKIVRWRRRVLVDAGDILGLARSYRQDQRNVRAHRALRKRRRGWA